MINKDCSKWGWCQVSKSDYSQKNPYQKNPYERNPYERNPYERNPYERNPYDRKTHERNPYDRNPYQKNPYERRDSYQKHSRGDGKCYTDADCVYGGCKFLNLDCSQWGWCQ